MPWYWTDSGLYWRDWRFQSLVFNWPTKFSLKAWFSVNQQTVKRLIFSWSNQFSNTKSLIFSWSTSTGGFKSLVFLLTNKTGKRLIFFWSNQNCFQYQKLGLFWTNKYWVRVKYQKLGLFLTNKYCNTGFELPSLDDDVDWRIGLTIELIATTFKQLAWNWPFLGWNLNSSWESKLLFRPRHVGLR